MILLSVTPLISSFLILKFWSSNLFSLFLYKKSFSFNYKILRNRLFKKKGRLWRTLILMKTCSNISALQTISLAFTWSLAFTTNFTWSILEYFVPNVHILKTSFQVIYASFQLVNFQIAWGWITYWFLYAFHHNDAKNRTPPPHTHTHTHTTTTTSFQNNFWMSIR